MHRADDAGITIATPRAAQRRGGVIRLRFPGDEQVARGLCSRGLVASYRGGIRVGPHFYNTAAEVDRFMDELIHLRSEIAS
jgi:kynureninase